MMLSDVCLSHTSGLSREQRGLVRLKLAQSHTWLERHFQGQRSRSPGRFTHRGVNASGSCSGDRRNVFSVGTYCYVAVCAVGSAARGASAPTEGGEGRGHIMAAARLRLVKKLVTVT